MAKKSRTPSKSNVAPAASIANKHKKPRATSGIVKNVVVTPENVGRCNSKLHILYIYIYTSTYIYIYVYTSTNIHGYIREQTNRNIKHITFTVTY